MLDDDFLKVYIIFSSVPLCDEILERKKLKSYFPQYIYVINYLKENGGRGSKRENVLPPKMTPAPPSSAGPTTGLMDEVEGEYVQTQPPASNDW